MNNILSRKEKINPEIFYEHYCEHNHGGRLIEIAKKYNIPLSDWIDLSTGINQNGYPVPDIPKSVWNRLPENNDELNKIAAQYYQCDSLIAVAGSQVAIQMIPTFFSKKTVGLIQPGYYEHAKHWMKQNHTIINFQHEPSNTLDNNLALIKKINNKIHLLDALVIINPNNPSGLYFSKQQLQQWHKILIKRSAYLIIDEAFMDSDETNSLLSPTLLPNLIILRSIGKFFGLAGIRLGFVFSNQFILDKISEIQGPWPISGPSRWVACKALSNNNWQNKTRFMLRKNSIRLKFLLTQYQLIPCGGTDLFQWVQTPHADEIYHRLNQQGILTRLFTDPESLRFGLPKDEPQWKKLEQALHICLN